VSYWGHRQLAAAAALAAFRGVDLAAGRALGIAFARPGRRDEADLVLDRA